MTEDDQEAPKPEWPNLTSADFLLEFEKRQSGPIYAVPTLFSSWNHACGDDGGGKGLARGWFVVIGGNPGYGKTILALLLAKDAVKARQKTAFVSMEMHHCQLAARFYAMATGYEIRKLEKGAGRFDPVVMGQVRQALRDLFPTGELLTNRGILSSLSDVLREMEMLADHGTTVFLVDYLQLIGLGDEDEINRQVTKAVTSLRRFALEKNALVIVLSQYNRTTSSNYHETPRIQGLNGGTIIEASVDQALLLDHSRYLKEPSAAKTWAILDKNKHGDRVDVAMRWDYKNLTAREAMPDEREGWTPEPEGPVAKKWRSRA